MVDSSIPKFFEKNRKEKLEILKNFSNLTETEIEIIKNSGGGISFEQADTMVENAIGVFSLPLGIATNFRVNQKDYLVPMVIEE
ncbi:MAG: 3-hydroxy-3-methylglutaryl-CoA reductase, partial [Nitrosopumilaceae archaeon]